ncbi:uncharacterized protein LOC133529733 [Cydia pomonella]|uniref:uncharacterized protein LOC133529733 n=1 Tax=Cydia pomonella TaxID=82600 RepID=UPI002ADD8309|nr:uncharacterized protein LOC133529733 [Cydia pomonella]
MALRHIIPIVILIIQLYGTSLAANLPQLSGNRLSEGADRDLPNATPINCGSSSPVRATIKATKTPSQVMKYFGSIAFTAGPIGHPQSPRPGTESKFKFAEVKGGKYVYALEVDPTGELAYWLPQGGSIDIPQRPNSNQPRYVFTPDFSGCSWTVTPLSNGMLRLRHVEGGREAAQFNNLSSGAKGGATTYAMQYKDYGYIVETRRLVGNVPAFAYMHYTGGHWTLNVQRKSCSPQPGGFTFNNQLLSGITLLESKSSYSAISGTKSYTIP